ncbi:DUF4249 domain-containing protein [Bacteroides neonati]|uniref:DUF4249 domain-containing protein n=1 Tax=Bacteroides neonati TaxID=1347393 RepID=UPI0004BA786D|nr:DUF4249 domain-containing protein [Bacteroides neonati]
MTIHYNHLLSALLLWAILATSCENQIDIDLKPTPTQLIIHAQMSANSTNNRIFLNLSDPVKLKEVTNGVIEIRINGVLSEKPQPILPSENKPAANSYLVTSAFRPGDVVRVDARTADGQYKAWAEVVVPQPAFIEEAIDTMTISIRYNSFYYPNAMRYRFKIKDRPNEQNYYRLILEQGGTAYLAGGETIPLQGSGTQMIINEDVVLTDGYPNIDTDAGLFDQASNMYAIFNDKLFANNNYTMTVYLLEQRFSHPTDYRIKLWWQIYTYIRVLSISETEFNYLKALNIIDSGSLDETMEPIKFASNVNGGLGIVSISSEASRKFYFEEHMYPK